MWLGVIDENVNWLGVQHAMLTFIILVVWGGVGNYMVYFSAGLTGISTDVYESAKLDGANGCLLYTSPFGSCCRCYGAVA